MIKHKPVMLKEVLESFDFKKNAKFLDLTLGSGGHSLGILNKMTSGELVAIDYYQKNVIAFRELLLEKKFVEKEDRLIKGSISVLLKNCNFAEINLDTKFDSVIADLGWSTDQIEKIPGLSYLSLDEDLDMRIDSTLGIKGSDLLNFWGEKNLTRMFKEYADLSIAYAKNLAFEIVKNRKRDAVLRVFQLNNLIDKVFGFKKESSSAKSKSIDSEKNNVYSKVYQGVRIAVNNEVTNLKNLLQNMNKFVVKGGKIVIIAFHSGESRIIEKFILENKENYLVLSEKYGNKYMRPSVEEVLENFSSRSAKFYLLEKK